MDSALFFVLVLLACLVFSAFFSGLETALSTLSVASIKKIIESRHIFSLGLSLWLKKPNRVLTAILVGNNIANTLAASLATVLAQDLFGNYAISAATFFVALILLIFGEITPKTFARHNASTIAPISMFMLLPIYVILLPVTLTLTYFASNLLKLMGGDIKSLGPFATEEDITYMIRLSHEEGVLKRSDGHLLQSVIEFRDTIVKESMVPRTDIGSFDVDTSHDEVLSRVLTDGHTRWPVYEKNIDNIIGVFHAKDLLRNPDINQDRTKFSLLKYLRPAKFVPDTMKITNLLKEFQGGNAHLAVAVDEYGGTAGIITLEDVLEEIVGEIRDEYDDEEKESDLNQLDENNYAASGKASIFDLGKELKLNLPQYDSCDTLGGFLIATHGRMPKVGSKINVDDCTFIIKAADERKIDKVHIYKTKL